MLIIVQFPVSFSSFISFSYIRLGRTDVRQQAYKQHLEENSGISQPGTSKSVPDSAKIQPTLGKFIN